MAKKQTAPRSKARRPVGALTLADVINRGDAVVTVPEAARILRMSVNRAYAAVSQGLLPSIRVGEHGLRVPTLALQNLLSGAAARPAE